jgi:hypothetical protein
MIKNFLKFSMKIRTTEIQNSNQNQSTPTTSLTKTQHKNKVIKFLIQLNLHRDLWHLLQYQKKNLI